MCRVLRIAAYIANVIMLLVVGYFVTESYGVERFICLLMALPPLLSIAALWQGPDLEERRLGRELNKARMKKELEELGGKAG